MKKLHQILILFMLVYLLVSEASGQGNKIYSEMSLDELLNIDVVVTASKKPEDLFEAPLSVTIIKKEEIVQSAVTSIPEALRLAPGLIVREITPGNYDIHIRGYDDITKNAYITLPYNTTTLVMIDNRIVYNNFTGGTLWETLPIDINDVEQIEVVRGPASALYGPNAVTGVINIITTQANKKGLSVFANGTLGNEQAKNANINLGYNWNDKTKLGASANFTQRYRFGEGYYDNNSNSYVLSDELSMIIEPVKDINSKDPWNFTDYQERLGSYYDENLSLQKLGGNLFFNHQFSEVSNIDVQLGAQGSQSQKTGFLNLATPLSQIESESFYTNTRIKLKNLFGQFSINKGEDISNFQFNSYQYTNMEASLEYYKQYKRISFRPGVNYKRAIYSSPISYDQPFSFSSLNYNFKDENRENSSYSASLLSEWKPNSKLRIIGAIRVDKFNINSNYSFNHELAVTYRHNKNNLIRYVYSRANKSPFIFDTYLNCNILLHMDYFDEGQSSPISIPVNLNIVGNDDLIYPGILNHEISWRTKISPSLSLDLEVFHSKVQNFVNANVYRQSSMVQQLDNSGGVDSIVSISATGKVIFENYDMEAQQYGGTFTFNFNPNKNIDFKLYGTFQKTRIAGKTNVEDEVTNIEIGDVTPENTVRIVIDSEMNPTQWSENLTPTFYGGFLVNYKPGKKWNLNTNAYFSTDQSFINYDYNNLLNEDGTGKSNLEMNTGSNFILNAKTSYRINDRTTTYISLKNILGEHREYGFADNIGRLFLIGVQWEL